MVTKPLRTKTVKIKNELYEKLKKEGIENYAEFVSDAVEKVMKENAAAKNKAILEERIEALENVNEGLEKKLDILFKISKLSADEQRITKEMGKIQNEKSELIKKGHLKSEEDTNKFLELTDNWNKLMDEYERISEEQNKFGELEDVVNDLTKA